MRKNKLFYGLISITGGLVIIGSAFCAWSFGVLPEARSQKELSIEITNVITGVGVIETNNKEVILRLDQGGIYDVNDVNYSNVGISLVDTNGDTIDSSFLEAVWKSTLDEYTYVVESNRDFFVGTVITLPIEYTKYITVITKENKFEEEKDGDGTTFISTMDSYTNIDESYMYWYMKVDGSTINGVNQLFKWVNKPTTLEEYKTMKTELENAGKIEITYKAYFA